MNIKKALLLFVGLNSLIGCTRDVQIEAPQEYVVSTLAASSEFDYITDIVVDSNNNLFVTDFMTNSILLITPNGAITTFAGGVSGFSDGTGTSAKFYYPIGLAIDSHDNLFVADVLNFSIRKITPTGVVTTIAGNGSSGDIDGVGSAAKFNYPYAISIDSHDNLFVVDERNHKIRKITPTGVVTTFAGSTQGLQDGNGVNTKFNRPKGITINSEDVLYIADTENNAIRKITPAGNVTTIAGGNSSGSFADGQGLAAKFYFPFGLVLDARDNLLVVDRYNQKIRKITQNGKVTTIMGDIQGFNDGIGTNALFNNPFGIAKDAVGNFYITDTNNYKVRKVVFE